jgi:plasmid stability protein
MSESRFIAALVPHSMRADLERSAAAHERSLSGEIRAALRRHLEGPGPSSSRGSGDARGDDGLTAGRRPPSA